MKHRFGNKKMFYLSFCIFVLLAFSCNGGDDLTLKHAFKDYFLIGTALNNDQVMGVDRLSANLAIQQFNSITNENSLKWERVHPEPDRYNFTPVDSFVAFGEKNGMFIVGHTLVWHNQTPDWVFEDTAGNPASREVLLARMKEHIQTVVGRYKGRIHGWDVVNEPLEDDGQLRQTKWMQIIGADYIEKAFEWAHETDPDAELYINDFNMWKPGKVAGVIRLINDLRAKDIKVNGIGLQGHWGLDYPLLEELEECFASYSTLDVPLMVTELEMDILPRPDNYTGAEITRSIAMGEKMNPYPDSLPDSMQKMLANRYADFFRIFGRYHQHISRITFWGVYDGQSWRNNWPIPGRSAYPLLFDDQLKPKPAFYSVIRTGMGQ